MKKSTMLFIGAVIVFIIGIIITTVGFATASTEAELIARSENNNFLWYVFASIMIAVAGFIMRKKGE